MDKNLLQDRSMFENVTTKSVAKYALLPGIVPMIRRLAERCGQFLFMFTMVFGAVGLIDKNHPCLRPENIGRYRFVDILGLATHNVVFDRKHIPQIVMFFATILTLVLTIAIVVASLAQLFVHTSTAYAQAYYGLETTQAKDDWSYQFLGRFFGNTGMDFWGGNSVDPRMSILQPMFRAMIQHYSIAIMVIAVFMIIYMAVTRLAESARTGEPFGKSFNNVWGPIRIVMCIGLLVPIGTGYNAAQLITFQVAEWGGALATNVWNAGLDNVRQSKFVVPNRPDYGFKFIRGVFLIRTCVGLWNRAEADDSGSKMYARPWISTESRTNSEMITIKFGPYMDKSFCGEIMFPRVRTIGSGAKPDKLVDIDTFAAKVETSYQHIVKTFLGDFTLDVAPPYGQRSGLNSAWSPGPYPWDVEDGSPVLITSSMHQDIDNAADQCIRTKNCKYDDFMPPGSVESWVRTYWTAIGYKDWGATPNATYNPTDDRFFNTPYFRDEVHTMNQKAIDILKSGQSHGWASAGAFYLRLTEMQNIITGSIDNRPVVTKLPILYGTSMNSPNIKANISSVLSGICSWGDHWLCGEAFKHLGDVHNCLGLANTWFINSPGYSPEFMKRIKYDSVFAQETMDTQVGAGLTGSPDNSFVQRLSVAFTEAMKIDREDLNPLGTLIALGGTYLSVSSLLYIIGGLLSVVQLTTLANVAENLGNILVVVGFTLFVVVPMMPFIHFMFAVVEWIMSVFEAVIGMPLWCLSFLSLGGEGLLEPAMPGVWMLFEIMIRPTIIIFSLVGAVMLFTASIAYINDAYMYFKGNAEGAIYDNYGLTLPFTWFTFALMHTFIIYSLANSCFKLMEWMPNSFMRWIKSGVSGFGDLAKAGLAGADPRVVTGLIKDYNKAIGPSAAIKAAGAVPGAVKKGAAAVGGAAQKAGQNVANNMSKLGNMPIAPGMQSMNSLIGRNRQGGVTGNGGGGDDEGGGSGSNRDEDQESAAGNDGDDNGGGGGNGGDDNAPSNADNAAGDVPEQGTPDSTPSQNASGPDANDEAPAKKPAGRWGSWTGTSNSGTRLNYSMSDSGNTNQSGRNGNAGDNSPQAQQTEKFRSDFDSGDFDLVKDKWNLSSNPRRAFVQYMEERKNMGEAAYAQMIRDAKNPPPKS